MLQFHGRKESYFLSNFLFLSPDSPLVTEEAILSYFNMVFETGIMLPWAGVVF